MNLERILTILLVVAAVLAAVPQIPVDAAIWGFILVVVGLVSGVMNAPDDIAQRVAIYVIATVLPTISNSLDSIWVVGPWVNMLLDNLAIGLQGMAVGMFIMALKDRLLPTASA